MPSSQPLTAAQALRWVVTPAQAALVWQPGVEAATSAEQRYGVYRAVRACLADTLTLEVPTTDYILLAAGVTDRRETFFTCLRGCKGFVVPTGLLGQTMQAMAAAGLDGIPVVWDHEGGYNRLLPPDKVGPPITPATGFPRAWPGQPEPKTLMTPRDYQCALVNEAVEATRGVIQAATGSGKTAMMAMMIARLGYAAETPADLPRTLILVASRSLVRDTRREVARWLGCPVGEYSASRQDLDPAVVVGLVPSLAAHAGEPEVQALLEGASVLFLDECHHLLRKATKKAQQAKDRINSGQWHALAMRCRAPYRYGLSATPLKIDDPFQNWRLVASTGPVLRNSITASTLIQAGFLARPFVYFLPHDGKRVGKRRGWAEAVEYGIVKCKARNAAIVEATRLLVDRGLKTLVLVERKEHGERLQALLYGHGLASKYIHGGLSQDQQEALLDWYREDEPGVTKVLVSTRILGEGTNVPDIAAVVYARGGKAFVQLFQSIGRGLRPKGGTDRPGECIVVIPDDKHNYYLREHVAYLRRYLAAESEYRVAADGVPLARFVDGVLRGVVDHEKDD